MRRSWGRVRNGKRTPCDKPKMNHCAMPLKAENHLQVLPNPPKSSHSLFSLVFLTGLLYILIPPHLPFPPRLQHIFLPLRPCFHLPLLCRHWIQHGDPIRTIAINYHRPIVQIARGIWHINNILRAHIGFAPHISMHE